MTSFHGLPSQKKKKAFLSPPPAYACPSLVSLSLCLCPFMHPLFCFSLASASTQTSFSSPRFSSFWSKRRGSSALRLVLPKSSECMLKHGRRGVAFGCVEVCVNSQSFSQRSLRACGHGYTVICFTLFTRAICCQVAGVTSPRLANVSIKSSRACLKAALFTHGVLVDRRGKTIQGKVILKRINKSTWCTFLDLSVREDRAVSNAKDFKSKCIIPIWRFKTFPAHPSLHATPGTPSHGIYLFIFLFICVL